MDCKYYGVCLVLDLMKDLNEAATNFVVHL